jgi:choline dehydrogenase
MDPAAMAGVQLRREIGNSAALNPFAKREVMPGNLKGSNSSASSAKPS